MKINTKILQLTLFSAIFLFGASQQASAQTNENARAGIKGGLNASNLYINDVDDENARIGFHVGLYGQIAASETVALQVELLYSTKGSNNYYSDGNFEQDVKYNLNYLELPVLAVFKLGEAVEFHLGGYASYLLNAKISSEGDLSNSVDDVDKDYLKSYDLGLSGGVGINLGAMQIGARYNYGLVEIQDSSEAQFFIGDAKNSCAQLFIAFNFNGNK